MITPSQYFDERAAQYRGDLYEGEATNHYQLLLRRRRALLEEMIGSLSGPALELGCGPGVLSEALLARGKLTLGDVSIQMVRLASENAGGRARAVQLSAAHLPFREESFNLVVAAGLLEYLDDEYSCLAEIRRVMTRGGTALISFLAPKRMERLVRRIAAWTANRGRDRPRLGRLDSRRFGPRLDHAHSLGAARRMLESAGFDVLRVRPFHYFYYPWARLLFRPSQYANRFLERLEGVCSMTGQLARSSIVLVRRTH